MTTVQYYGIEVALWMIAAEIAIVAHLDVFSWALMGRAALSLAYQFTAAKQS